MMEINDILCRILQIEHGFQHIKVFTLENKEMKSLLGYQQFITFVAIWEKKYPILKKYKADRNIAYFTYMIFQIQVQRCIYDKLD